MIRSLIPIQRRVRCKQKIKTLSICDEREGEREKVREKKREKNWWVCAPLFVRMYECDDDVMSNKARARNNNDDDGDDYISNCWLVGARTITFFERRNSYFTACVTATATPAAIAHVTSEASLSELVLAVIAAQWWQFCCFCFFPFFCYATFWTANE